MADAALQPLFPDLHDPVDHGDCLEICGRIPAIISALGHDDAILFFERCIASVERDRENHLCQFLKI